LLQTHTELQLALQLGGGARRSIHADLAKTQEEYKARPKASDGSVLGTVAEAPTLKNNGHTKSSLMRMDPANLENSKALHEGGRVRADK
jgi:hypothetical protein